MSGHATFTYKVFQEKEQYRRECEAKDKEIASLKAQLKREMAVTDMAAMDLPNQALELARETVKARG